MEDKRQRTSKPKKFEDEEVGALLAQDPNQTQEKFAESLNVDRSTISRRLKTIGMIQKQGNWVPYELKPRDIERRKMTCELLLQRHRKKSFLYRIMTSDEKWIYYDNLKCKKSWCRRTLNIDGKAEYSWLMLCI